MSKAINPLEMVPGSLGFAHAIDDGQALFVWLNDDWHFEYRCDPDEVGDFGEKMERLAADARLSLAEATEQKAG